MGGTYANRSQEAKQRALDAKNAKARKRMSEAREQRGNKCEWCGSEEKLEFDHIDRTTKVRSLSQLAGNGEKAFWDEFKKCQLLCYMCHRKKTRDNAEFAGNKLEHGTKSMYDNGKCRCDPCSAAQKEWGAKYYQENKERLKQQGGDYYAKNKEQVKKKVMERYYANKELTEQQ